MHMREVCVESTVPWGVSVWQQVVALMLKHMQDARCLHYLLGSRPTHCTLGENQETTHDGLCQRKQAKRFSDSQVFKNQNCLNVAQMNYFTGLALRTMFGTLALVHTWLQWLVLPESHL